ncbi:tRNA (adenosine(37)-N6)-dimethylallyltransferase MiaA [Candidatus Bealeia paramacronuclearis]|uniref:tRNA dimethylallyltransferase n=1 Tax=Candidatus Bealeia paramacronuclearis TaxID=1921001 RepID=A0ABZ2C3W9_9PROT|nr:tRNA (adenosine(37)-N6)-dimethylallyltransferase MiaA [Candidatus Bealeia paramacronuclearis]
MKEKQHLQHYIVAGPTGSGKSSYALEFAQKVGGIVINADSLQIYQDLPILTAQPSTQDKEIVPHCLYGFLGPEGQYSALKWVEDVTHILEEATSPCILVGGTGFYFNTLLEGLSPIPDVPQATKDYVRPLKLLEVRYLLETQDPLMAERLHPHDLQRNARALEVLLGTGRSLSFWQSLRRNPSPYAFYKIGIFPERASHESAMKERVLKMWEEGAIEEVSFLLEKGLSEIASLRSAIGFDEIESYLKGDLSLEIAQNLMMIKTRQYAKRQLTWFRHQMKFDEILSNIIGSKERST